MRKGRKALPVIFGRNDQRGSVLIEMMVSVIVFAIVVASIAFYFIYHVGTINNGHAQLKLQRVGSLLMEQMARAIREGKSIDLPEPEDDTFYPNLMVTYPDASTECFSFNSSNKDVEGGPDYGDLSPLEVLDDSRTVAGDTYTHRIACDDLGFKREGDRVIIQFTLKHDLENANTDDDLKISFGSAVKLRG